MTRAEFAELKALAEQHSPEMWRELQYAVDEELEAWLAQLRQVDASRAGMPLPEALIGSGTALVEGLL
jgi:hypothetical protein